MLNFPIQDFMDYESCYNYLEQLLHPSGLTCSCGQSLSKGQFPHKRRANNLPCFKCKSCGKVFNLFTNTIFKGIHYNCIIIVLMLRGFAQGKTTQHLCKELSVSYNNLLDWRHKLQEFAFENRSVSPLTDLEIESNEVFQNAGEKGAPHLDPTDPPRKRANKKKG